jgi:hypothetical protein
MNIRKKNLHPIKRDPNALLIAGVALAAVALTGCNVKTFDTRSADAALHPTPNSWTQRALSPEDIARKPLSVATAKAATQLITKTEQAQDYQPSTTKSADGATVFSWSPLGSTTKPVITLTYRGTSLDFQAKPADATITDGVTATWNLLNPMDQNIKDPTLGDATGPLQVTNGFNPNAVDITNLGAKYQEQKTTAMFVTPTFPSVGPKFDIVTEGIPTNPALHVTSEVQITSDTPNTLDYVLPNTLPTLELATKALDTYIG